MSDQVFSSTLQPVWGFTEAISSCNLERARVVSVAPQFISVLLLQLMAGSSPGEDVDQVQLVM